MRGLNECQYGPIAACTRSIRSPTAPVSYHCARLVVVRDGSAILTSEFGEKPVRVGDVIALAPDTPCGSEPEGTITITTVYLDHDYIVDQVFWQHSALLADRWDARDFADELYPERAQILRLGENGVRRLAPWLNELVALSADSPSPERFHGSSQMRV
ncbi:hypothetical protein GCM10009584_11150 [Ornithinimicrobium humiphilum]|uniref:hypothetical protein n=1 Tax=Ornithinimicrobium humiphilum TaxID=125288 RepID=UPI00114E908E|nr:hypothetical protein [Ornithinimicrobium humiphilum]